MANELPKRKSTRLKNFDYSTVGAYFVTICVRDRLQILSDIVKKDNELPVGEGGLAYGNAKTGNQPVGDGALDVPQIDKPVGEGLAPPVYQTLLKPCGRISEEQLLLLEKRYSNVTVEDYIIMPDHIHFIILLHRKTGGASPSPTLNTITCAFKSLTSRICKQLCGVEKIFQRSYIDHIIRDKEDYETRRKYIYENPMRWYYKHMIEE